MWRFTTLSGNRCYIFSGQSPAEADFNLLDTARKVELYGIQMHAAKVRVLGLRIHGAHWGDAI